MEFIGSVLSFIFIAIVIGTALAFGFMILVWIMVAGLALTAFFYIREMVRRWLFVRGATPKPPPAHPNVIEGEYKDLTD